MARTLGLRLSVLKLHGPDSRTASVSPKTLWLGLTDAVIVLNSAVLNTGFFLGVGGEGNTTNCNISNSFWELGEEQNKILTFEI